MENETCNSDSAHVLGESKLTKNLSNITDKDNEKSDKKRETKFVINTIAYVPDHKFSDDSSSEETDGSFSDAAFNFDIRDEKSFPFTTNFKPKTKKINRKLSDQFSHCSVSDDSVSDDSVSDTTDSNYSDADFHFNLKDKSFVPFTTKEKPIPEIEEINEELSDSNQSDSNSSLITPFFKKLSQNGFEKDDKDKLATSVSVSIALNRMKSLSTRKNKSLYLELESKIEKSEIKYEKFVFFWKCYWFEHVNGKRKREPVNQEKVRKFYKQLKKRNKKKAERFREMQEKKVHVPYQVLREFAKNHDKTKKLVNEFRQEDPNANIYLSLIDLDTVDFNGIYSAYLRIVKDYNTPTVMSTGYEYSTDEPAYQLISQIDRKIRVITASHIPLGTYYPEPNTCVLIEKGRDTLLESFIDTSNKKGNLESACLLKEVQKRENATFVFSDDKPLITTIPYRARLTKSHKTQISFTNEFQEGFPPTEMDLKSSKSVTQNNFHENVWLTNLFINNGIKFKTYDIKKYIKHPADLKQSEKLVELYVKDTENSCKRIEAIDKLKEYVRPEYVGVVDVIFRKSVLRHCIHLISEISKIKEKDEFEMFSSEGVEVTSLEEKEKKEKEEEKMKEELKKYIIPNDVDKIVKATEAIKRYIEIYKIEFIRSEDEQKLLDILKAYNININRIPIDKFTMLADQRLLELIEKEIIDSEDLLRSTTEELRYICDKEEILEAVENKNIDFDDLLNFLKIFEDGFSTIDLALEEYPIEDILERYNEDPIHLMFMAGDPIQIVEENEDNLKIVKIGVEYYDVTEEDCPWLEHVRMSNGEIVDDEDLFHSEEEQEQEEEEVEEEPVTKRRRS